MKHVSVSKGLSKLELCNKIALVGFISCVGLEGLNLNNFHINCVLSAEKWHHLLFVAHSNVIDRTTTQDNLFGLHIHPGHHGRVRAVDQIQTQAKDMPLPLSEQDRTLHGAVVVGVASCLQHAEERLVRRGSERSCCAQVIHTLEQVKGQDATAVTFAVSELPGDLVRLACGNEVEVSYFPEPVSVLLGAICRRVEEIAADPIHIVWQRRGHLVSDGKFALPAISKGAAGMTAVESDGHKKLLFLGNLL